MIAACAAIVSTALAGETINRQLELNYTDQVFARKGEVVLTHADLDILLSRIPEADRAGVLADPSRVEKLINDLFRARLIAADGIADGLLEDPEIQAHLYQLAMVYLAEQQAGRIQEAAELDDYTRQARELYLRNPQAHAREERADFTHLMLTTEARSDAQAEALLGEILERLEAGESFAALIDEYSEDPGRDRNQGRYRDVDPDELDDAFADTLRELAEPGQFTGPVRSRFGWHIIRLDRYQPAGVAEFEEVADQLRERARRNHRHRVYERYVRELTDAPLEIADGAVRALLERHGAEFHPGTLQPDGDDGPGENRP